MTRGEYFKKRKCKNNHCLPMSNIAWCDLENISSLRLQDYCGNPKCRCQKQNTFTPRQFQLEGAGFINTIKEIKGAQTAWKKFLKPEVNVAATFFDMAVSARTKNPKVGQDTTKILKSISAGIILSLTDKHGNEMRLRGYVNFFKYSLLSK